jgi:hypothetical protein
MITERSFEMSPVSHDEMRTITTVRILGAPLELDHFGRIAEPVKIDVVPLPWKG